MPVALENYQSKAKVVLKVCVAFVSVEMRVKSPSVFIDEGLEINSQVYKKLLHEEVLP